MSSTPPPHARNSLPLNTCVLRSSSASQIHIAGSTWISVSRQFEKSSFRPWKSITKAPSAKTSGAKIRRERLSARTAASTAASSFSRIACRSARPCLTATWRRDSSRSPRRERGAPRAVIRSRGNNCRGRGALATVLLGLAPLAPDRGEDGADERQRDHHEQVADHGEDDAEGAERLAVRRKSCWKEERRGGRSAPKDDRRQQRARKQGPKGDLPVEQEVRHAEPEDQRAKQPGRNEDSPTARVAKLGLGYQDERERAREDEEEDRSEEHTSE